MQKGRGAHGSGTVVAALFGASLVATGAASAHGYKRNAIEVVHPWTSVKGDAEGRDAIVAMKLKNSSKVPDRLISAESTAAERVELRAADDTLVAGGVEIPASGTLELKRGTFHVRLVGLHKRLTAYADLPVTLVLEKAGRIAVDVLVEEAQE